MDKNLRLRLVVRRNGLPDTRILFNVPLAHDPTVANLVEIVNDTIPLETEDWGLEDYAVELHDKDGNAYECLHFQPIASVLDKDDEVFIRPLLTNDLKKRRLGGRIQIAQGGQHLVDGVPYGRPRLRTPRGRPVVHIAPRKRRRLTYHGDFDQDDPEDEYLDDYEDDYDQGIGERYIGAGERQQRDKDNDEPLLLTQDGEPVLRDRSRRVRFPHNLTTSVHVQKSNADAEDEEGGDEASGSDDGEDDEDDEEDGENEEYDIQDELRGLSEEAAANGPAGAQDREQGRFRPLNGNVGEHVGRSSASREQVDDFDRATDEEARNESPVQPQPPATEIRTQLDLELIDKITAIRCAFPAVSAIYCEKLLIKHDRDVSSVWKKLARQVRPRLDLAHTMVLNTQLELPNEIQVLSSPPRKPAEVPGEVSRIEEDDDEFSSSPSNNEQGDEVAEDQNSSSGDEEDDEDSDSDSDSDSSSSGSESQHPSLSHTKEHQRKSPQDSDSSSNDSSGSGTYFKRRISSRRRQKVIESSPQTSKATTGRAGIARGASKPPYEAASLSDKPESSSSGDSDETSAKGKEAESSSSSNSESDSDSSSSSSSESGSDSDSEARPSTFSKSNKTPATLRTVNTQTASSVRPAPPSAVQETDRATVPPGQGLTRTQKRNARRRLQKQRQVVSSDEAGPEEAESTKASDADLTAKKAALLRSLGTSDAPSGHSEGAAERDLGSSPAIDARPSLMDTEENSEAWRNKISYRAVECVNEGVELSEPPFPFVQRWDPQQQRPRRGKRKSRNDTQFYDESSQHSAKKRRVEPSRQLVDVYEENMTLNYDDVPSYPDEEDPKMDSHNAGSTEWNESAEDEEDDLPLLPQNLSSAPSLHPEDLRPGMVIAWKQLLMSKATNWQPMLSDFMTAVVIEVEEGGHNFKVQLAKRDRDVDKTEKEYDEEGQRIYGKFEAPDDDDTEEEEGNEDEDLGFRDLSFTETTDPRIVQQPATPASIEKTPQLPGIDIEVAASQPEHKRDSERCDSNDSRGNNSSSSGDQSTTLDHENTLQGQRQHDEKSTLHPNVSQGPDTVGESFIAGTNYGVDMCEDQDEDEDEGEDDEDEDEDEEEDEDEDEDEDDGEDDEADDSAQYPAQLYAQLVNSGEQDPISDERRKEISQLINDGGFRRVRASTDQSEFLRIGSPSRQLEEEATLVLFSHQEDLPERASSEAPSEYGSKGPSQQTSHLPVSELARDCFHSAPRSSSKALCEGRIGDTTGPADPAGRIEYPSLNASFTSQTSARSGRQFDPNFVAHSDDLGIELPDDSVIMDGFDDDDASLDDSSEPDVSTGNNGRGNREQTPAQQNYDLHTVINTNAVFTPSKSAQRGPEDSSPPGSGSSSSTRSSSIFLGIELIGSQPASTRFQEQIKEESFGADRVQGEPLSQPAQRLSQLPNTDEAGLPWAASSRSPGKGRKSSVNGSPQSFQRTRQTSPLVDLPSSPLAATTKSPVKGKNKSVIGPSTPNGRPKSFIASFDASVSPPTRSKPRQRKGSASSAARSQESRNPFNAASPSGLNVANKTKASTRTSSDHKESVYNPLQDSQVVSLLTSSPAPEESEVEPESAYYEVYADDDIDEDYTESMPNLRRTTRRVPSSRAGRGASVPLAATDAADEQGWVPSTYQGPDGKTSGRTGGRLSTAGF